MQTSASMWVRTTNLICRNRPTVIKVHVTFCISVQGQQPLQTERAQLINRAQSGIVCGKRW